MRILGIDPGYAIIGWGVLDYKGNKFSVVDYGAITTQAKTPFPLRLQMIYTGMIGLFDTYHPEVMSMEKLFYNNNAKTVIDVAQARGVITLSAQQKNVPIFEYTPLPGGEEAGTGDDPPDFEFRENTQAGRHG